MGRGIAPALIGMVAGTALQLQQAALWPVWAYGIGACAGVALLFLRRRPAILLAFATLAFALTGLRAAAFISQSLDPSIEGRDVAVTGMVAAMPQRNESGLRFRLEVESSDVRLPPQLMLGWYGAQAAEDAGSIDLARAVPDLRAGERWRMMVRLKAPHGNVNPHGFDYELRLWEQGVQATGYVRAGPKDTAPKRIGDTWVHPVERARQAVRDAVYRRIADRRTAGELAALVTGDQNV